MSQTFSKMSSQDQQRVLAKLQREKKEAHRKVLLGRAKFATLITALALFFGTLVWLGY